MQSSIFNVSGRVALVTGASSGLGVQFARTLAGHGARLVLAARRVERLQALTDELAADGVEVLPVRCDVTREDEVIALIEAAIERFGRIDVLVNNAGLGAMHPLEQTSLDEWEAVQAVNVTGLFLCCKHTVPHMRARGYGKIVNLSSMFGHVGNTAITAAAYHASKGAVDNLTNAMAGELSRHGITVNAIGPGFFESEMTESVIHDEEFLQFVKGRCPMERVGRAGELDGALLFLASDASSYVTGQTIYVDGGWTAV
ncbi:glucose 1-dehydrogenase [Aquisalimonas sp.]|uniref:SDR family NAD(P)-dependent oxidoreductase n=1 Tax=Aquisalimonas sp. TaxID=1872621 RepID=UPI0025C3C078|nr:glucose 1-dehydrogenase [Aquisalimonas sp.]